jgi:hypothetical protein
MTRDETLVISNGTSFFCGYRDRCQERFDKVSSEKLIDPTRKCSAIAKWWITDLFSRFSNHRSESRSSIRLQEVVSRPSEMAICEQSHSFGDLSILQCFPRYKENWQRKMLPPIESNSGQSRYFWTSCSASQASGDWRSVSPGLNSITRFEFQIQQDLFNCQADHSHICFGSDIMSQKKLESHCA